METETTTAPQYTTRDTYAGRWYTTAKAGQGAATWTAAELAAHAAEGVVWESIGTPLGATREHFCRGRYVADAAGNLHMFSASGSKVLVHPADRALRILVNL
jgi:hypothetical protein